ncbi:HD domain-containing protein [[Eubacterium] hominis]|uniref:HD domain-containing protein n=1 Tax=[Eubacterium] hominis TaxID=2764325 RepID=UPI003A4D9080
MRKEELQFLNDILNELIENTSLSDMNAYIQHGDISTLTHSILVAYYSYAIDRKLHLHSDAKSLITGALLHDYFLYDWHEKQSWHKWHGFRHARFAYENAKRDMSLNKTETEIIRKHMWPLTIIPPTCREAWLVNVVDTFSSMIEVLIAYRIFRMLKKPWVLRPMQLLNF